MDDFVTVFLFIESIDKIAFNIENGKSLGLYFLVVGLAGLLFLTLDTFIFQKRKFDNNFSNLIKLEKSLISKFGYLIIGGIFWIIFVPTSYTIQDSQYLYLMNIYETKQFETIEGFVYITQTKARVPHDIIIVDGNRFGVDSQSYSFGYRSGILEDGDYAKIFYINSLSNSPSDITILRIDIKK